MPLSPGAPTTLSGIALARALIRQALEAAGLPADATVDVTAINRDYGKALPAFAQVAGEAAEEAGEVLGLGDAADRIRKKSTRLEEVDAFRGELEQALTRVVAASNVCRADLGGEITQVFQAADAVGLHPKTPGDKKELVARATRALVGLRDARAAAFRNAGSATRAENDHASDKAAAEGRIAALQSELHKAQLQASLLGGQPVAPAPVAELSVPAPASLARQRRRPGRVK